MISLRIFIFIFLRAETWAVFTWWVIIFVRWFFLLRNLCGGLFLGYLLLFVAIWLGWLLVFALLLQVVLIFNSWRVKPFWWWFLSNPGFYFAWLIHWIFILINTYWIWAYFGLFSHHLEDMVLIDSRVIVQTCRQARAYKCWFLALICRLNCLVRFWACRIKHIIILTTIGCLAELFGTKEVSLFFRMWISSYIVFLYILLGI